MVSNSVVASVECKNSVFKSSYPYGVVFNTWSYKKNYICARIPIRTFKAGCGSTKQYLRILMYGGCTLHVGILVVSTTAPYTDYCQAESQQMWGEKFNFILIVSPGLRFDWPFRERVEHSLPSIVHYPGTHISATSLVLNSDAFQRFSRFQNQRWCYLSAGQSA